MQTPTENTAENTVFELRQYTLYGGKRDTLISLFEKNFIETQDVVGAHVLGTFRDLDDPDRFVWLRGFRDMQTRPQALEAFYGHSPAWLAHKKEANATMVDSDNILLLRPASSPPQLQSSALNSSASPAIYGVTIYYLGDVDERQFADFFVHALLPRLNASGVHPIAVLTTDEEPNNFPGCLCGNTIVSFSGWRAGPARMIVQLSRPKCGPGAAGGTKLQKPCFPP